MWYMYPSLLRIGVQAFTTAQLCQNNIQMSSTPGAYSIFYDNDPNFVYTNDNCTSTDQKVIAVSWYVIDCGPAIEAACGSTSTYSAVAGSWTFGWHQTGGSACQAALYSPVKIDSAGGAGFLDSECCVKNFEAAVQALQTHHPQSPGHDYSAPNRASINIATSGFPFTRSLYDGSLQNEATGVQVDATLPSYILQG